MTNQGQIVFFVGFQTCEHSLIIAKYSLFLFSFFFDTHPTEFFMSMLFPCFWSPSPLAGNLDSVPYLQIGVFFARLRDTDIDHRLSEQLFSVDCGSISMFQ
jgi:hypothetical protein